MYAIKAAVFNYLTKNQKSHLCSHLRSMVKRFAGVNAGDVLDEFVEEETHFDEMGSPNLHFAVENFSNSEFMSDLKRYIEALVKDIERKKAFKEEMAPMLEQQKQYMKEQRKRAQEYKMDREKPTAKQMKYYKGLCKGKNIEPKELEEASKLDLKKWIEELVNNAQED